MATRRKKAPLGTLPGNRRVDDAYQHLISILDRKRKPRALFIIQMGDDGEFVADGFGEQIVRSDLSFIAAAMLRHASESE